MEPFAACLRSRYRPRMGLSFGSVHVLSAGEASFEAAVAAARALVGRSRARRIVLRDAGRFISAFDRQGAHDALAKRLSAALETPAVSVEVHDSDVLRLGLFVGGQLVDRHLTNDDDGDGAPAHGHAARWKPVLVAPARELSRAGSSPQMFAEEALDDIAAALGLEPGHARAGFDGADALGGRGAEVGRAGQERKRPARRSRAVAPRLELAAQMEEQRLVARLEADARARRTQAGLPYCGEPGLVELTLGNDGAAGRGLRVRLEGPAAADPSLQWDGARVVVQRRCVEAPLVAVGGALVLQLPELHVPAGDDFGRDLSVQLRVVGREPGWKPFEAAVEVLEPRSRAARGARRFLLARRP